jgi:hypothetical protein
MSVADPSAQRAYKTIGIQLTDEVSAATGEVASRGGTLKGWLACSITYDRPDGVIADAARRPKWLPKSTSREKGTKNFTDAASQTQYRVCARFFRNAKVKRPATAANSVDCHWWFAKA